MSVAVKQRSSLPVRQEVSTPSPAVLFQNQRIDSFTICFTVDGEPVKANKSDGYLALKPRGHVRLTQHFVLVSDSSLPTVKAVLRSLNAFYSRSSDYKVAQVHYQPHR